MQARPWSAPDDDFATFISGKRSLQLPNALCVASFAAHLYKKLKALNEQLGKKNKKKNRTSKRGML
jgi:hypothetical protein